MKYKILFANKAVVVKTLEYAKELAQTTYKCYFRVAIFDENNKRVAKYEWGREI